MALTPEWRQARQGRTRSEGRAGKRKGWRGGMTALGFWGASAPDTDEKRNEALLKTLRDLGYEEAQFASLKRHYGPEGHHFIDTIRADGKIVWTSSVIQGERIILTRREHTSLKEFETGFLAEKVGNATSIEVHCRPVKIEGSTARSMAILEFLHQKGYDKAGGISN